MLAKHLEDLKADRNLRRRQGSYYTPAHISRALLDLSLAPILDRCASIVDLLNLRIYDPACGAGAFLIPVYEMLRERARHFGEPSADVSVCLVGTDINPEAIDLCQAELQKIGGSNARLFVADALETSWDQEFDLVIGNPPFGSPIQAEGVARSVLGEGLVGQADIAYTFLSLACKWARSPQDRGKVAMVLPRAFLNARAARKFREAPPGGFRPEALITIDEPQHFEGANVYACLVVLGDGDQVIRGKLGEKPSTVQVQFGNWWGTENESIGVVLGDHFTVRQSLTVDEAYRLLPCVREGGIGPKLLVTGSIDPGISYWGVRPTRYLKSRFQQPVIDVSGVEFAPLLRRVSESKRPKIVVAGLSQQLEAFLDVKGEYLGAVSTFTISDPKDEVACLKELCDFLNGEAANKAFHSVCGSSALGGGSITMRKDFLANLALPEALSPQAN